MMIQKFKSIFTTAALLSSAALATPLLADTEDAGRIVPVQEQLSTEFKVVAVGTTFFSELREQEIVADSLTDCAMRQIDLVEANADLLNNSAGVHLATSCRYDVIPAQSYLPSYIIENKVRTGQAALDRMTQVLNSGDVPEQSKETMAECISYMLNMAAEYINDHNLEAGFDVSVLCKAEDTGQALPLTVSYGVDRGNNPMHSL